MMSIEQPHNPSCWERTYVAVETFSLKERIHVAI